MCVRKPVSMGRQSCLLRRARCRVDIPAPRLSSGNGKFSVAAPGDGLVVERSRDQAAVEYPDESVRHSAQRLSVRLAGSSFLVVEAPGTGRRRNSGERPPLAGITETMVVNLPPFTGHLKSARSEKGWPYGKAQKSEAFVPEFKRDAVALLRSSGRPIKQVAMELGVSDTALGAWSRAEANALPAKT